MTIQLNPVPVQVTNIEAALSLLEACTGEAQYLALKNLCENNGIWTVPEDHNHYSPVLYEVSLYGVSAISDDVDTLALNWIRAARNTLRSIKTGAAA